MTATATTAAASHEGLHGLTVYLSPRSATCDSGHENYPLKLVAQRAGNGNETGSISTWLSHQQEVDKWWFYI